MDYRDATLDEMNAIIEEGILHVRKQPEKSVFTLMISGGSAFSGGTISKLKEVARDNTPLCQSWCDCWRDGSLQGRFQRGGHVQQTALLSL
jgi:hypothetical protein